MPKKIKSFTVQENLDLTQCPKSVLEYWHDTDVCVVHNPKLPINTVIVGLIGMLMFAGHDITDDVIGMVKYQPGQWHQVGDIETYWDLDTDTVQARHDKSGFTYGLVIVDHRPPA